jgi:hypothetical protein
MACLLFLATTACDVQSSEDERNVFLFFQRLTSVMTFEQRPLETLAFIVEALTPTVKVSGWTPASHRHIMLIIILGRAHCSLFSKFL